MKASIVYLEPRTSYKGKLRSDTLWAALCWSIRMVHGKDVLEKLINAYSTPSGYEDLFYISSTLPYIWKNGKRVVFLPKPLPQKQVPIDGKDYELVRKQLRSLKIQNKRSWLEKEMFEYQYGDREYLPNFTYKSPMLVNKPMTHNAIDRITGNPLKIKERIGQKIKEKGQLYHTEEWFVVNDNKNEKAGIYFLVKGSMNLLEGALRFLEHFGIGGDRSTGKGSFIIDWEEFELLEASEGEEFMTLSLYAPKTQELIDFSKKPELVFCKTESRRGWKSFQGKGAPKNDAVLYMQEGSVFPILKDHKDDLGCNPYVGEHDVGHSIYQYGHAFPVKINLNKHAY